VLKEKLSGEAGDNLTCTLYDIFQYVFTNLMCWKDNIIAIIPTELQNDDSEGDSNAGEKIGLLFFILIRTFLNEIRSSTVNNW
jgi:hypothetical protein